MLDPRAVVHKASGSWRSGTSHRVCSKVRPARQASLLLRRFSDQYSSLQTSVTTALVEPLRTRCTLCALFAGDFKPKPSSSRRQVQMAGGSVQVVLFLLRGMDRAGQVPCPMRTKLPGVICVSHQPCWLSSNDAQ